MTAQQKKAALIAKLEEIQDLNNVPSVRRENGTQIPKLSTK